MIGPKGLGHRLTSQVIWAGNPQFWVFLSAIFTGVTRGDPSQYSMPNHSGRICQLWGQNSQNSEKSDERNSKFQKCKNKFELLTK